MGSNNDFCCFKGTTYVAVVALILRYKLRSFFYTNNIDFENRLRFDKVIDIDLGGPDI